MFAHASIQNWWWTALPAAH
ncbi:trp operon leader peptide [Streptomyces sp. MZ04]|nr:trp operon leader peptide [Streptomyces sp. MZ04]